MENFFGILKFEMFYLQKFKSFEGFKMKWKCIKIIIIMLV